MPVLLALTVSHPEPTGVTAVVSYDLTDRSLDEQQLNAMLSRLDNLITTGIPASAKPWPLPLLDAWRQVRLGASPAQAATTLWPFYLRRVRSWLSTGITVPLAARRAHLAKAHVCLGRWIADDNRRRS
ncbi:hypothetical protein ACSNOH_01405 [Streptomyces sp. URMC 127]|uniref:hypothetical protein n=1 Tax=Streptomyces sp. URMC 127 TaxID=3423402 RepID=UPI003F1A51E9